MVIEIGLFTNDILLDAVYKFEKHENGAKNTPL